MATTLIDLYENLLRASRRLQWSEPVQCVNVIDGDTIVIADGTNVTRVRLAAIDAPELAFQTRPAEFYAEQSKALLSMWIMGATILTAPEPAQPDPDVYDRSVLWLRFPQLESNINALMLMFGAARLRDDWPTTAHTLLRPLQARARLHRVGMWQKYSPRSC